MKKVYSSHDPMQVAQLRGLLEANHIPCVTRNDYLLGAAGELPPMECWPEIWVLEDFQLERARGLVDAFLHPGSGPPAAWTCAGCGESVEPPFTQCWRCGLERVGW